MRTALVLSSLTLGLMLALAGCQQAEESGQPVDRTADEPAAAAEETPAVPESLARVRPEIYVPVTLSADLEGLSEKQKRMIPILIEASAIMDELFWRQAYGDREELLPELADEDARRFAEINYGPWDRLDDDKPFVGGVGPKPAGARFYPSDMSKEEFEAAQLQTKSSLYTLVRRTDAGSLRTVPYHQAYSGQLQRASDLLRRAAAMAEDPAFARYLELRAEALVTDNYQPSDLIWMDMKNNRIDLVIGAIETYEDQLFGYKAAYEAYVLLKDMAWSEALSRFAAFLPELQQGLPVPPQYKAETPGSDSDLNAYDVLYYAGHSNAGSKTIAINLPNDEDVQLQKGTRRLQLKNAMRAKFDKILLPIAAELIAEDQRQHVTFDAFFANTMFHEVAHGLGIKNTINDRGTVRGALKEHASTLEEGKADILGLYMVTRLYEKGEIESGSLMDNYVTFLAGIFRSVRFGASSAHGRANMVRFNFFEQQQAFSRDAASGTYSANFDRMQGAVDALSNKILTLQGQGDYAGAAKLVDEMGLIGRQLAEDLARLERAGIPVDVVFEQGTEVLGLGP